MTEYTAEIVTWKNVCTSHAIDFEQSDVHNLVQNRQGGGK